MPIYDPLMARLANIVVKKLGVILSEAVAVSR